MFGDLLQHVGRHVLVRELLDDLLSALRHVPGPSEHERQSSQRAGQHAERHLVARVPHRLARHLRVAVVVRRTDMLKRRRQRSLVLPCGEGPQLDESRMNVVLMPGGSANAMVEDPNIILHLSAIRAT